MTDTETAPAGNSGTELREENERLRAENEELRARLATVANGFVAGVEYIDAEAAEKTEALQSLLSEVLGWFRLDDFAGVRCWEASVDDPAWVRWLDRAREAGVAGLPGREEADE